MNLDQFRSAFRTGGLESVGVTASGGLFFVTGIPHRGERITLATTRGKQARSFRNPGNAIAILHDIGARKVEVDTSEWLPEQSEAEGRRRLDTAERLRWAHAAATHDSWFRAEVEQSIREADAHGAAWLSEGEVEVQSAAHRARWRAQETRSK